MSKTAILTGANSNFGTQIAITLADEGHSVIATLKDKEGINSEIASQLNAVDNVEVFEMDVRSDESVTIAVNKIIERYGVIDVLINCADTTGCGLLEATSLQKIKDIYETNVFGVIRMYQAVLPVMRKHNCGLIINLSSFAGIFALPFLAPYSSSKHAVEAITEAVRPELFPYNIENVSIQCGSNSSILHQVEACNADKTLITENYNNNAKSLKQHLSSKVEENTAQYGLSPQDVADGILALMNMKNGSRPKQFPLDPSAKGADLEFLSSRQHHRSELLNNKYGFEF